eukprot:TRINITY_DN2251_c0_g1_i4.p2 TRINITY_DN2251_c0_g1~~TRINITY_DN2251_c0_g1_i4.p2  ORF type:complete len:138 (-),score=7.77 TRINITY_DN2251_c0_g1_i4:426-839(-)
MVCLQRHVPRLGTKVKTFREEVPYSIVGTTSKKQTTHGTQRSPVVPTLVFDDFRGSLESGSGTFHVVIWKVLGQTMKKKNWGRGVDDEMQRLLIIADQRCVSKQAKDEITDNHEQRRSEQNKIHRTENTTSMLGVSK